MSSRRKIWAFSILGAALAVVLVLFAATVPFSTDTLRDRIVSTLSERLNSDVTLADLHLRLFPRMHAVGTDLVIRQHGRAALPPLITVKRFEVHADLVGLMRKRVAHVELEGLDIEIPPGHDADDERTVGTISATPLSNSRDSQILKDLEEGVVIDRIDSQNARLAITSSKPQKPPNVWAIHTLHLQQVGVGRAMPYRATLTNGIPPGEIVTEGTFGPWDTAEPGDTRLVGTYTFDKADLSVFKGIAGVLSSHGSFRGSLARIDATGETDTPDFTIQVGGHPFPLHTTFHSIIDGTNGDTLLKRIDASFLQSSLVATGGVVDATPGKHGRTVTLDIQMDHARVEDIMTMAVKADSPPMTGALRLTTKFLLPPGDSDVVERLRLDGQFAITAARFTNYDVQGKIEELSVRGRGIKRPRTSKDRVLSNFEGRFMLGGGTLRLSSLQFTVPGAAVRLAGSYGLTRETLDFKGQLLLDAKISETVTGFKSVLLKVVDPLFRQKDGSGSVLPIRIAGQRQAPVFGLDVKKALKRDR